MDRESFTLFTVIEASLIRRVCRKICISSIHWFVLLGENPHTFTYEEKKLYAIPALWSKYVTGILAFSNN